MIDSAITDRMQREWNERAREDAHFYVAFGRRDQDPEEFFDTSSDIVKSFESELRRFPAGANRRAWRALEIGCGPGRLLKPMSRSFGEIHGIDVSDEMIARARANLRGIEHAHVHHTSGADLAPFADESFQFVYSYAVFQHIPSREVVLQYLREAHRVLRTGGLLRVQINGLDAVSQSPDTWSGVRFTAAEIREFARAQDMQLLAIEGARTQYMWTTLRKRAAGWADARPPQGTRIRRITNANSSEPVAPASGRFAAITLWMEHLPPDCDLNRLDLRVDGVPAVGTYIGPPESDGLQQLNVLLPRLERTGLLPVHVLWNGQRLCEPAMLRVIPPGPHVPVLLSVADGVNLLAGTRIVSRSVKATIETESPEALTATVNGKPLEKLDTFCADPLPPRYEVNLTLPENIAPGPHRLELRLGRRLLGSVSLDVASGDGSGH